MTAASRGAGIPASENTDQGNGTRWKAGVATTTITPTESMWLAGWAARREPSNGTASELYARALALEDPHGSRLVMVTVDLIAITRDISDAVTKQIHAQFGLTRDRILFNASHTHTGPEIRPDKVPFFEIPNEYARKIDPYVAMLENKLAETISSALAALEPVTLSVGNATAVFAGNRRAASGPTDNDVPILCATGAEGTPRAIVFGYACHNLTLPPSFVQYCSEYAGYARRFIEEAHPSATAFYISGAGADQDPYPAGTLELAMQHGRDLAGSVSRVLSEPMQTIRGGLAVVLEEVELEFEPLPSHEELKQNLESDDAPLARKSRYLLDALAAGRQFARTQPCPIQVVRFGSELLLIALGSEPVVQFARDFKSQFAGPMVWVAGYCNDMAGYIPTRQIQREGGYEAGRAMLWSALPAPYDETTEERVKRAVALLVGRLLDS